LKLAELTELAELAELVVLEVQQPYHLQYVLIQIVILVWSQFLLVKNAKTDISYFYQDYPLVVLLSLSAPAVNILIFYFIDIYININRTT